MFSFPQSPIHLHRLPGIGWCSIEDKGGPAMRHELNFWVLGGDMRQGKLAQLLAEDGHRVHTYALEDGAVPAPGLTAEPGLSGVEQADWLSSLSLTTAF